MILPACQSLVKLTQKWSFIDPSLRPEPPTVINYNIHFTSQSWVSSKVTLSWRRHSATRWTSHRVFTASHLWAADRNVSPEQRCWAHFSTSDISYRDPDVDQNISREVYLPAVRPLKSSVDKMTSLLSLTCGVYFNQSLLFSSLPVFCFVFLVPLVPLWLFTSPNVRQRARVYKKALVWMCVIVWTRLKTCSMLMPLRWCFGDVLNVF